MRSTRSARFLGTLLGALALGTLLACGGGDSPATDTPSESPAAAAPSAATPEPESDRFKGSPDTPLTADMLSQGQLPKDFPSDMPTYPDAEPALSLLVPEQGGLVAFTSKASDREIYDFYNEQLVEQGWTIDKTGTSPLSISSSKGERQAVIKIAAMEDHSEIAITLSGL